MDCPDCRAAVLEACNVHDAGSNTGDAILKLMPSRDDLVAIAVQYPWTPPRSFVGKLRTPYDVRRASLGSIFATIHVAIDDPVPEVVLIHGGTDLSTILTAEMRRVPSWLRPAVRNRRFRYASVHRLVY